MRRASWVLAILLTTALAGLLRAQQNGAARTGERLKPGDVIKLWIWQEKDWSGEFLVPESGEVVFPRIGARNVTTQSKSALRDSILDALRIYLNNPSIEISFLKRINILGAVRTPGVYNVDETMTVATALALAGGAERDGKQDRVELYRGDQKLIASINRRTRIVELPLESGDQLYVPERSWTNRNTPVIAALVSGVVSVAIAFLTTR
jgi:polysaccharide export outer membrane protein